MKEEKLQEAKRLYESANADQKYVLESLFPELAGSEDERILEIIKHCIGSRYLHTSTIKGISQKQCFAWLEKQGEQKPTIEMKSVEESLGIDSDTYNEIVNECIYDEQKSQRMISAEAKEAMYGKPAWTKEDDVRLQACIDALQAESLMGKVDTVMTKWLESLKQRIGGKL